MQNKMLSISLIENLIFVHLNPILVVCFFSDRFLINIKFNSDLFLYLKPGIFIRNKNPEACIILRLSAELNYTLLQLIQFPP